MLTELQNNLDAILLDKNTNLLPQNLKDGITCLGVEGTLTSESGRVKLFETKEEMEQDTTAQEDDLAVVYREEIQNMTSETQTQYITFPETVILPEAFTDSVYTMLRAVDSSVMFDGNVQLDKTSFRFDEFSETGMIRVSYTSSDGITYTREEFMGDSGDLTNPVDLGTLIHCNIPEEWNDTLGYFMQTVGNTFDGLYKYTSENTKYYILKDGKRVEIPDFRSESLNGSSCEIAIMWNVVTDESNQITSFDAVTESYFDNDNKYFYVDTDNVIKCYERVSGSNNILNTNVHKEGDKWVSTKSNIFSGSVIVNKDDCMLTRINIYNTDNVIVIPAAEPDYDYSYQIAPSQLTLDSASQLLPDIIAYGKKGIVTGDGSIETPDNTFTDISAQLYCNIQKQYDNMEPIILTDENKIVDTGMYLIPVKLDGTPLLDTSNVTNMRYMFRDCTLLTAIPQLDTSNVSDMYGVFHSCTSLITISQLDTSDATNMSAMFYGCSSLTAIPQLNTSNVTDMSSMFNRCTSLTTIPQLDTSNVTKMNSMFYGCSSLTAIPQLNTSNVTGVSYTFLGCDSLSNDSLNNILAMLTNAIKITSNKTLKYVGLSEAQATTCTTSSNWSACETAGWTTGY